MKIAIIDLLGLTYDGNTLSERGLGGSESAVILMSKELANLGHNVTVFNNCIDSKASPGFYNNVEYIDHSTPPNNIIYDIVISSRSVRPYFAGHQYAWITANAKKKILWMHDTFCEGDEHVEAMLMQGVIDEVFTLSDFHSWYFTTADHGNKRNFEVLKHKFWQTRNGAVTHIDKVDLSKKDKNHFVYNASATKGLIPLITKVWPKIKQAIPEAHLTCIGGYYRFREGAEPDAQEKTVNDLIESKPEGVTFTGVIPQYQIAEILSNGYMMLYPTAFPETFGISSLESLLYKTPIVTNTFGALEETAIAEACYKIPYSSTNNALFNNIDEDRQAEIFVNSVISAHQNHYLHYQKQNYCDVVKDVAGWDTVALQWDQHFHQIMKIPYPVEKYRQVSRINDKVARVFGRRFSNPEDRKIYKSYGEQRRIVVISPFRNAKDYLVNHVKSVAAQDYDNYLHVIIDDASDDDSIETIKGFTNPKTVVIRNTKRKGCVQNQLNAICEHVKDDDIVMLLDGDDWLVNNNTIFHYYNDLYSQGYDFTYGSMWSLADNIPLIAQDWDSNQKYPWDIPYTHLRTMKGWIALDIDWANYMVDGKWMMAGADNPMFREAISYAKNPIAVKEIMVNYNDINPLNDYKVNGEEQNRNAKVRPTKKKILIAVPTAKNVETATMKSIYDLIVPDDYETELQFFYGYRVDQVRNLIADWGKNYDYVFNVDADIVLPNDSLVRLLKADKPIAAGMYIQRKPGQHILEVYGESGNIPYENLKDKGLVQVKAVGFGCCLVKQETFLGIPYPHFDYKTAIDHKNTVSEDWYFCAKAAQHGFTTWVDTSIKCEHIGDIRYTINDNIKATEDESHLEKIAKQDLLPEDHAKYLKKMSEDVHPTVIYDIGACVLHWTKKAKEAWPSSQYYLFDAAEAVETFLEKSGHPYHLGVLTDENEKKIEFYEDSENPGGNSYYLETTGAFNESHKSVRTGYTLDSIVLHNGWPMPDLIKIDVQGAELDILKGAKRCLDKCKDVILEAQHVNYNEGAPKVAEVIQYMESIGFTLIKRFSNGQVDADYHFKKL